MPDDPPTDTAHRVRSHKVFSLNGASEPRPTMYSTDINRAVIDLAGDDPAWFEAIRRRVVLSRPEIRNQLLSDSHRQEVALIDAERQYAVVVNSGSANTTAGGDESSPAKRQAARASLTPAEAAAVLGVSRNTVYALCKSERLNYQRVGRQIRIKPEDLDNISPPSSGSSHW